MRGGAVCRNATSLGLAMLAMLASLAIASAQNADTPADDDETAAQTADTPPPQDDEELAAVLRDALNLKFDDDLPLRNPPQSVWQMRTPGLDWNQTANANGTSAYSVKRSLPVDWDAKIGADFGLNDSIRTDPTPALPLSPAPKNSGAAWANVQVPGVASIDARINAGSEPNKFSISRTLPLGSETSLTLQNSYAVTEATSSALSGRASPVWSNDREAKVSFAPTGTTFGAGATSSTADGVTHNRLSAEQKVFDRLNVTTTLSDVGTPAQSRSITAGFKTQW